MTLSPFWNLFFLTTILFTTIVSTNNPGHLVIIKKDSVSAFHDTLNPIDRKISFTIETESNG